MLRVLIADEVDKECPTRLRAAGFDVSERFEISAEELIKVVGDYEILVVRSRTKVTREVIASGKNLRLIGRVGVGLDTIDTKAAEQKGIKVINTPQMSTIAVAELVMTMMLDLVRGVHLANESMKKGLWEKKRFHGTELNGKTLGVVGLGRIGKAVAERAKSFGMKLLVYDVIVDEETLKRFGAERSATMENLLKRSDIVTIHVPLLPETRKMINAKTLAQFKTGAYLINASRGEVVDCKDLLDALKSKKLAGAALDVYENEPPKEPWEKELVAMPNVIATPHIGAQTVEAQIAGAVMIAENIINAFKPL
ncbi:MAG: hydroxyacid dehydrogenase [Candidatus Methanomethylicaceae archaeon]|jgi:D-3-phosphoglycerate dehydrogenase